MALIELALIQFQKIISLHMDVKERILASCSYSVTLVFLPSLFLLKFKV